MEIAVPGATLAVQEHGEGPPALFVHGFPLSAAMWRPVGERLARVGSRVLAPDLRGFGASQGAPAPDLAVHVEDLVALLDALGLDEPVPWIGFSMGGYVCLEAWRRHPERIGALGLIDTRAAADDAAGRQAREATATAVQAKGSHVVADAMIEKLFAPEAPQALRAMWHERMRSAAPEAVAAALRAMAARADSTGLLATIDVPTLVLVGAQDVITPPRDAEALAAGIQGAGYAVIPAAGHMAPVEQPEAVATHLEAFLKRGY